MKRGFGIIFIVIGLALVVLIGGGVGYAVLHKNTDASSLQNSTTKSHAMDSLGDQKSCAASTIPCATIENILGDSVAAYGTNFPQESYARLVNVSTGEDFGFLRSVNFSSNRTEGPLSVGFTECTPAGDYLIRIFQDFSGSFDDTHIVTESSKFHFGGSYSIAQCEAAQAGKPIKRDETSLPTCAVTTSKPTYHFTDQLTFSWTTQNATYVAFDPAASEQIGLSSDKLPPSGSLTLTQHNPKGVQYDVIGDLQVVMRAYSKTGEGYCVVRFHINTPDQDAHQ